MGSIYLSNLAGWLRSAGLNVVEYEGWQKRARGSGGYDALPLCVMWHHTASPASWDGQKDAQYCAVGDTDAPLANLYIQRDGTVWVLAAGATNTNGKGNSIKFSRGTVPQDSMNTRALGIECGNDGVGERWPQAQIDAMFKTSNVCNAQFGNRPDDIATHQFYAPTRKIDPATCNVAGPWVPTSCTSSGSWHRGDVQAECLARAAGTTPIPEEDMTDEQASQLAAIYSAVGSGQLVSDNVWHQTVPDGLTGAESAMWAQVANANANAANALAVSQTILQKLIDAGVIQ